MWLAYRAKKGDADAFVKLMEENKMAMYKVAKSYLRNEEDVADAMSETVLAAFEHIKELRRPEYFKTWLIRILINQCKLLIKQRNMYCLTEEMAEESSEDESFANLEFMDMLSELPEKDRILFVLHYGEGYTAKEIAGILDMNENTVARRTKQPLEYPNFGSVFKRPEGYFVGKLVQDSGLRGFSIGGAQVSEKHTGFMINTGDATCQDVLDLIKHVQDTVYEKFGVHLQTEVEFIGGENK